MAAENGHIARLLEFLADPMHSSRLNPLHTTLKFANVFLGVFEEKNPK